MKTGKKNKNKTPLDKLGQSTLEFVMTLTILVFIIIFFLQLALLFAAGNYVHYATFMAGRAYLAAGVDNTDQINRANLVLSRMLKRDLGGDDRWPPILKGEDIGAGPQEGTVAVRGAEVGLQAGGGGPSDPFFDPDSSWQDGVRYSFRGRLYMVPLGGTGPEQLVNLKSESWLSKEPSFRECVNYMEAQKGSSGDGVPMFYDNGC